MTALPTRTRKEQNPARAALVGGQTTRAKPGGPLAPVLSAARQGRIEGTAGETASIPQRTRADRFGDTWTVHTGPVARRLRRQIERDQIEALARYDRDPSPENKAAFAAIADTEAEIGRRAGMRKVA